MDYYELMVIGTGGRGVLLLGRLLAEAGMEKYKYSLFFPNYAPAMRGGESECTIILSNNYVNSPVRFNPDFALAMTKSALDLIRERVKSGGTLMVDSSVMPDKVERDDINVLYVPATERAVALRRVCACSGLVTGAALCVAY